MATSACVVVYVVSLQRNLGKPQSFPLQVGLCDFMFHLLVVLPSQLGVRSVFCLLLVGSCHMLWQGSLRATCQLAEQLHFSPSITNCSVMAA